MSEFLELIPEQYREPLKAAGITTAEGLAKNWADAQSMLGASVRIPSKEASAEDLAAFDAKLAEKVPGLVRLPQDGDTEGFSRLYSALGKPESPDKYQFDAIERLEEGTAKQMSEWVAKIAHEANLTTAQAKRVYAAIAESTRDNTEAYTATLQERQEALKREWGNGYPQRVAMAQGLLKAIGGEEGVKLVEGELAATGLEHHPTLLKILAKAAEGMDEDKLMIDVDRSRLPKSLAEIDAQIGEIRGNSKHPYHDPRNPGHSAACAVMERLYAERAALRSQAA